MHNLAAGHKYFGTCTPSECALIQNISILFIGLKARKIIQGMILSPSALSACTKEMLNFEKCITTNFLAPSGHYNFHQWPGVSTI